MNWRTSKPTQGRYIVIDRMYGQVEVAVYRPDLGGMIRGRWLGHDAVRCFIPVEDLPKPPDRD